MKDPKKNVALNIGKRGRSLCKSFRAQLERMNSRLNWVIIRVPFDVQKTWGTRGHLKVNVEVNGHPFRTSLFPNGSGQHHMLVNKKMQSAANISPGMQAEFKVHPDTAERIVTVPAELERIFKREVAIGRWFDRLNHSTRDYIAKWVAEAKQSKTRQRRAEEMAERLLETMEAERELPPMIRSALDGTPKARAGWERMTETQRRMQLLGIFYYRRPESRARRIEKAVQAAVEIAKR